MWALADGVDIDECIALLVGDTWWDILMLAVPGLGLSMSSERL